MSSGRLGSRRHDNLWPSSSSSSSSSSSALDEQISNEAEHAALQDHRVNKDYRKNRERVVYKFLDWYKHHANKYNVFEKTNATKWTIKPKAWLRMMDRKKGAGNALFDYILYARKKFTLRWKWECHILQRYALPYYLN
jgi:hypothetical protein